ncbi:hypothetical protein P6166_03255 [Stenotrophomonas sp. HITSZ_GD]|uniref:hypothetical protein n=1 Tax=Stenotrophomonas sp. HITSZ_GD TaxID=3037248 RepID=UPI00240E3BE6|nr:hypothetical protein [Stenotrophomonas sp. HITSZ_GD]MDG2524374.1 hypothetical protein [Stenotrophomonas sp. HITSZ_GD]
MIRTLSEKEVKQVSGGKADFSGVTSRVDSTAEILRVGSNDRWLNAARRVFMYNALFR